MRRELIDAGWLVSRGRRHVLGWIPLLLLGSVLALGVAKLLVGIDRGRPVGFLGLLLFVTIAAALLLAFRTIVRTREGDAVVDRVKAREYTGLRRPGPAVQPPPASCL